MASILWKRRFLRAWHQRPKPVSDAISFVWYVLRRFNNDDSLMVASSLTYTSLLGLVPILAIFLAVLGAFPAFDEIRDQAKEFLLAPLVPEAGAAAREQITIFLSNTRELTAVGVLGLAVTAFILLWTIESAFNTIWRVVEPRSWGTRLLAFWTILTLTPILMGTSVSIGDWFEQKADDEIVAAVLFEILKHGFSFYLGLTDPYRIVYGAMATIPIFLLWIYLSWCMILVGAEFAAAIPDWRLDRDARRRGPPGPGERLAMAIAVLRAIWSATGDDERPHREVLEHRIPGGAEAYSRVLGELINTGYVVVTEDERLAVARDLGDTTIYKLMRDLGLDLGTSVGPHFSAGRTDAGAMPPWVVELRSLLMSVDKAKHGLLDRPVKDLMRERPKPRLDEAAE